MYRSLRSAFPRTLVLLLLASAAVPAFGQLLPPPPPNPGNPLTPAKARLGKVLFWDEQLSSSRTVSCGTCHIPKTGGGDPRSATSPLALHPGFDGLYTGNNGEEEDNILGSPGVPKADADGFYMMTTHFGLDVQTTGRRTNSMINAAYSPSLFWDGRAAAEFRDPITNAVILPNGAALESQAMGPPANDVEMGHVGRTWTDVVARIGASQPLALATDAPTPLILWINNRTYAQLFAEAFPANPVISAENVGKAIASYERTLFSDRTPFDDFLADVPGALTALEAQGRDVFAATNCDRCHSGALLSDNQFHYIGLRPAQEDEGRFTVTGEVGDRGKMRTPSLRNLELRSPYMHNGRLATIEDVVDFYNRGGDFDAPNKDPFVRPLNLTTEDRDALIAFLKRPLTDSRVVREDFPFDRPKLFTESGRAPSIVGVGQAGTGGEIPMVVAREPALIGNTITVGVQNGLASAATLLVIDDVAPGLVPPGSGDLAFVNTVLAADGSTSLRVTIPNNPALADREFFGRWYVTDPGGAGGLAISPVFRFKVFPTFAAGTVWVDNFETGNTSRWSSTVP
jgi:cytochrome c peroxidase